MRRTPSALRSSRLLLAALLLPALAGAHAPEERVPGHASGSGEHAGPPRVMVVGDSIARGYRPILGNRLGARASVDLDYGFTGDSESLRRELPGFLHHVEWDLVLLNSGLHDLIRVGEEHEPKVALERYEENLLWSLYLVRTRSRARVAFVLTTPVIDARSAPEGAPVVRTSADVEAYNRAARRVCAALDVPVIDPAEALPAEELGALMAPDGIHPLRPGMERLAALVARDVERLGLLAPR